MAKARILNMVYTECYPAKEAAFNKWYNEVHIPMLMKYKGMKKVTRYKITDEKAKKPRFLAVYEYDTMAAYKALNDSQEFKDAIAEMNETWKSGFDITGYTLCEPLKTFER